MWGTPAPFSAERWLDEYHPDVRVREVSLPGNLQGCVDHQKRTIYLARNLSPVDRRCSLAYECGQIVHGPTPVDPVQAAAHQRAAADWAAQMLIPSEALFDAFASASSCTAAAEMLGVDVPTLRARLRCMTDAEQDGVLEAVLQSKMAA